MFRCTLAEAILKSWGNTIHISGTSKGPQTVMASISKDEGKDIECSQKSVLADPAREHIVCFRLSKQTIKVKSSSEGRGRKNMFRDTSSALGSHSQHLA